MELLKGLIDQLAEWLFAERICLNCGHTGRRFIRKGDADTGICASCDPVAWDTGQREPSPQATEALNERRLWRAVK